MILKGFREVLGAFFRSNFGINLFVERCFFAFTSANVPQVTLSSFADLALFSPLCLVSSVH